MLADINNLAASNSAMESVQLLKAESMNPERERESERSKNPLSWLSIMLLPKFLTKLLFF